MDNDTKELLNRLISLTERLVEAYEAFVVSQSRIVEQTLKTMHMAQTMIEDEKE